MPGGGVALLQTLPALAQLKAEGDEDVGIDIIRKAFEEPVRQIAYNAGAEGAIVVEKVKEAKAGIGYNAATGKYEDMIAAGIVDPAKVTRSALQHAASIASMMLTTEAMVADIPKEEPAAPMMPPGGGMGMM